MFAQSTEACDPFTPLHNFRVTKSILQPCCNDNMRTTMIKNCQFSYIPNPQLQSFWPHSKTHFGRIHGFHFDAHTSHIGKRLFNLLYTRRDLTLMRI